MNVQLELLRGVTAFLGSQCERTLTVGFFYTFEVVTIEIAGGLYGLDVLDDLFCSG